MGITDQSHHGSPSVWAVGPRTCTTLLPATWPPWVPEINPRNTSHTRTNEGGPQKERAAKKRDEGKCKLEVNGVTGEPSMETRHCPSSRCSGNVQPQQAREGEFIGINVESGHEERMKASQSREAGHSLPTKGILRDRS